MGKILLVLFSLMAFFGTNRAAVAGGDDCGACPLSSQARNVVEESASRISQETLWIVSQSHGGPFPDRGFALNLIGWSQSHMGVFTLIENCSGPQTFDPFCEPCAPGEACEGYQRCSQLACEAAGIDTIRLWWQPAPVRYTTDLETIRRSLVNYTARPTRNIRYDSTAIADHLVLTWSENDSVTVRSGSAVNASNMLRARGLVGPDGPLSADVHVKYPALACKKAAETKIDLAVNAEAITTGTVRVGGRVIGRITSSHESAPRIVWTSACR